MNSTLLFGILNSNKTFNEENTHDTSSLMTFVCEMFLTFSSVHQAIYN